MLRLSFIYSFDVFLLSLDASSNAKELWIDQQRFYAVNSALVCVKLLSEYLALLEQLPSLYAEVLQKLVEFLQVSGNVYRVRCRS